MRERCVGLALIAGVTMLLLAAAHAQNSPGFVGPKLGESPSPAVGEQVPALVGFDLDGRRVTVDYAQAALSTVVYNIRPFSPFVVRNEANFAAIVREAGRRFRFVVVSARGNERLGEYIGGIRPSWGSTPVEVVKDVSEEIYQDMKLGGFPSTLVISPSGRVIRNFDGAYGGLSRWAKTRDVESFFGVKLPAPVDRAEGMR